MNLELEKPGAGGVGLESSTDNDVFVIQDGEVLYLQGNKAEYFYIINRGKIGLFDKSKDRLFSKNSVGAGEFLCSNNLFSKKHLEYTAIAVESTEIVRIKMSDMKAVINKCPEWVSDIMQTIWGRLEASLNVLDEHQIMDDRIKKKIKMTKEVENRYMESIERFIGGRNQF
ncbi:MAG: cyclic nucleotide-binding domain-containing protein [Bacteriovoracaceae bacterium]|nr:cyclic nucleotide-binding domain-containing protein [Bacteriovoracaceae bacterium]